MSSTLPQLTWADCDHVFAVLHAARIEPIVVGGQAVNLWAHHYGVKPSAYAAPVASKDIDVLGTIELARSCAVALGGECRDARKSPVPLTAVVLLGGEDDGLQIDFQATSAPNTFEEIEEAAVPLPTTWGHVRVMHPLHCVKSRAYNIMEIYQGGKKKYDNPHGHAQLRAAMETFRTFVGELAGASEGARKVLNVYEALFKFCREPMAHRLWASKGIDVFSCIEPLQSLPTQFVEVRYPQMQTAIQNKRTR